MRRTLILTALCLMMIAPVSDARRAKRGKAWEGRPPREAIEAFRLYKLTEYLELDEDMAAKVYPRLAAIDAKRDEFAKARREMMKELREMMSKDKPNYSKAAGLAEKIRGLRIENHQRMEQLHDELFGLFNDEQKAKFVLFQTRFERRLKEMANKAGKHGGRPDRHGGPDGCDGPGGPGPHGGGW